jgi:hypothetical protein
MADQSGRGGNIGVGRSESMFVVPLEHQPKVHREPTGEHLAELLFNRDPG